MQTIGHSTLEEYAKLFWEREKLKNGKDGGVNPLERLRVEHPYKLPFGVSDPEKVIIEIVRLDCIKEVEDLLIHDYMVGHKWMQDRQIIASSRKLGELATTFLQGSYFEKPSGDAQYRLFHKWKTVGCLNNSIGSKNRPLIQFDGKEFEIVDGWGRLLPFLALVQKGLTFYPVECFVASKKQLS
jgi:hypothetical protein